MAITTNDTLMETLSTHNAQGQPFVKVGENNIPIASLSIEGSNTIINLEVVG